MNLTTTSKTEEGYKNNSFDIIRYFASVMVMLQHFSSYELIYSGQSTALFSQIRNITIEFSGVVILFCVSGFLSAASRQKTTSRDYIRKRILRISPGLWLCTLIYLAVRFVVSKNRFDRSIIVYLLTQAIGVAYTPGSFNDFATGSINGALWTVMVQMQLYILMDLLWDRIRRRNLLRWILVLILYALINLLYYVIFGTSEGGVAKIMSRLCLPYMMWYVFGVFGFCYKEKIIRLLKKSFPFLFMLYIAVITSVRLKTGYYTDIFTGMMLPVLIIGAAYYLPAFRIRIDISYEMFLYHWLVLNLIIQYDLYNRFNIGITLLIFFAGTIALSLFSHYVLKGLTNTFSRIFERFCSRG
jgi:peptidoglycan/LPS O-acetylase OafA/YrhL